MHLRDALSFRRLGRTGSANQGKIHHLASQPCLERINTGLGVWCVRHRQRQHLYPRHYQTHLAQKRRFMCAACSGLGQDLVATWRARQVLATVRIASVVLGTPRQKGMRSNNIDSRSHKYTNFPHQTEAQSHRNKSHLYYLKEYIDNWQEQIDGQQEKPHHIPKPKAGQVI